MRSLLILALTVGLVASSGCFGKDDDPPATTTPSGNMTSGGTPPTGATPTTPTANNTPTTPAKPAPRELCALAADFQSIQPATGPPPGPGTSSADCGTVPAGYTKLTISGNFTSGEALMVTTGTSVSVLDATGAAVLTCNGPSAPGPQAVTACAGEVAAVAGAAYTIAYTGDGNIDFAGSVTIS